MSTRHQRMVDRYEAGNIEAATIIASDPAKYPPDGLMGQWAALVLQRAKARPVKTAESRVEAVHKSEAA